MQKKKLQLKSLVLSSFKTCDSLRGGTGMTFDPLACTGFCGTGETCPECAYTLEGQNTCGGPQFTDGC